MFKPFERDSKILGFYCISNKDFIFFGTRHASIEILKSVFPFLTFSLLNQVHQTDVFHIDTPSKELPMADGQWTNQDNVALVIKTADCVPLMIKTPRAIGALHAGWRGVEGNIVRALLTRKPFSQDAVECFVGPHITKASFEVGEDVAQKILASDPLRDGSAIEDRGTEGKKNVDLHKVLLNQVLFEKEDAKTHLVPNNTFEEAPLFWSFRRDGADSGRQYSFIARISRTDFPKLKL